MTPDFQRGVEAALLQAADEADRRATTHGHYDGATLRNFAMWARRSARETTAPAPAAVADPGAVSEGDVARMLTSDFAVEVALNEWSCDLFTDDGPKPGAMRRMRRVLEAVVSSVFADRAIRAEATPPVDLSALRAVAPGLRLASEYHRKQATYGGASWELHARCQTAVDVALDLLVRAEDATPAEPVAASGLASDPHRRACNCAPGVICMACRMLGPQEPAEPVRCSGRYELASGFTHCVLAAGHDTDHMDARGGMWGRTSDEEGGRHG